MGPHQVDEDVVQASAGPQGVDLPSRHDPPAVDNRDLVAEPLHQLHDVAGEHDRAAAGGEAGQDVADGPGRHRVDRLEGLVEKQHLGVVQQRYRQGHLLAHPGRVVHDQLVAGAGQPKRLEQLTGTLRDDVRGQLTKPVAELQ